MYHLRETHEERLPTWTDERGEVPVDGEMTE